MGGLLLGVDGGNTKTIAVLARVDGTVAGVVFAASTTDGDVGYALTTPQIMPLVQKAETRTAAVSTEGCVP